jgi:hypothetical protein
MKKFFALLLSLMMVAPVWADTQEHLKINKKAPCETVVIGKTYAVILEGNVLAIGFDCPFKSKEHNAGDIVDFTNEQAIYTCEGTLVIPAGSTFEGLILNVVKPKWFNKNARVYMQINRLNFPDGQCFALNAKPFYKDYALKESAWMNAGRVALSTVTLGIIGTGAGIGFGFIPNPAKLGTGVAAGVSTGASIGFIAGMIAKGLNYNAKEGEQIFVILLDDARIAR